MTARPCLVAPGPCALGTGSRRRVHVPAALARGARGEDPFALQRHAKWPFCSETPWRERWNGRRNAELTHVGLSCQLRCNDDPVPGRAINTTLPHCVVDGVRATPGFRPPRFALSSLPISTSRPNAYPQPPTPRSTTEQCPHRRHDGAVATRSRSAPPKAARPRRSRS